MQRAVLLVKQPEMQLQGKKSALFLYSRVQSSLQCVNPRALSALCIPANVPQILLFSQCLQAVFGEGGLWHVINLQLQNVSI